MSRNPRLPRHTIALLAVLLAAAVVSAQELPLAGGPTGLEWQQAGDGAETVTLHVGTARLEPVAIDGQTWAVVRVPRARLMMDRGRPALPFFGGQLLLEPSHSFEVTDVSITTEVFDLTAMGYAGPAPSKGHFDRSIDPETVPWTFDDKVYGGVQPYPTARVNLADPALAGPLRLQSLRVPAAQWSPVDNTLTVLTSVTATIHSKTGGMNLRRRPAPKPNVLFEQVARSRALNYQPTRDGLAPGRLLILAHDDLVSAVEPLADWHRLVGYPTLLEPLSTVPHAGSSPTADEIAAYIQSLYDAPEGLAWIILVGDAAEIPFLRGVNENAPCDPCYTKLEGDDNWPDAAISRISASTPAEVTVQVDKILTYERYPDTGSAAAWYTAAFGIAGDDVGGSPSMADWERMDLLKDDLLEPAYHYTEFDEIYHNPSESDVAVAVEDGRSLGLYIGHGGDLYWVTSGFSVSDVHDLTNADMLPVIWDVACVNGAFHSNDECFAESWLRQEGGGAVSFEAATTNETWVPPCDAQRGVIDALRLETAFTTGAQHLAGKANCFDLNGDSDGSEGTRFMEQSHLFGSCLLWPRSTEPRIPEEPLDANVTPTSATLTVTVDGAPLALAGGAIVSFYSEQGGDPVVVGSGLTDASGVVTASLSGDATHCHIHGYNLVPTVYELAARPEGRISLDAATYSCSSTATVSVSDSNIPGASDATIDTIEVTVSAPGGSAQVTLTENRADGNRFIGSLELGTDLSVADGETLTATYTDADDGAGGTDIERTATAVLDCAGPQITAVTATTDHESMTVTFTTDEPATTVVRYGTVRPPSVTTDDDAFVTSHQLAIGGLDACTRHWFEVEAVDELGNPSSDDNGGVYYVGDTGGWEVVLDETFDSDPGWTTTGEWAFGAPEGANDPSSGHTGTTFYGYNHTATNDGNYPNQMGEEYLTTDPIDISEASSLYLSFWRNLGVEHASYDHAAVEVSVDGGPWQVVWENPAGSGSSISDSDWTEQSQSLAAEAPSGSSTLSIRWRMGTSDYSVNDKGWNIDDVVIEGAVPCLICSDPPTWSAEAGVSSVQDMDACAVSGFTVDWDEATSTCAMDITYDVWVQHGTTVDLLQPPTFLGVTATQLDVLGVTPGQEYAVAVRAVDEFGNVDGNTNVEVITPSGEMSGDVNGDASCEHTDTTALLDHLFTGAPVAGSADVDCSGAVDAGDVACLPLFESNDLY
jgi:hypothetical protein